MQDKLQEHKHYEMPWAFTVKKLGLNKDVCVDTYDLIKKKWAGLGRITHLVYETDQAGKIHIHGVIMLRKGFYRQRLVVKGFNLNLTEINSMEHWLRYIEKEKNRIVNNNYLF